ncbi:GIY-YIG nuclease family protein, partial [Ruegeria sp. 2012CJ41-6]
AQPAKEGKLSDQPVYTSHKDIIRAMRPIQRKAAALLISDVLANTPPSSVIEAQGRYREQLGEGGLVDDGRGWRDDIRDTSVFCLLRNGFAKGKAVTLHKSDQTLTGWSADEASLRQAAALETEYGGNLRQLKIRMAMVRDFETIGQGLEAVYVYTDSRLDQAGYACCKIGRHDSSDVNSVATRILEQYGTGSAGLPVLRYLLKTDDATALETKLHRLFSKHRLKDAFGTEWFGMNYRDIEMVTRDRWWQSNRWRSVP